MPDAIKMIDPKTGQIHVVYHSIDAKELHEQRGCVYVENDPRYSPSKEEVVDTNEIESGTGVKIPEALKKKQAVKVDSETKTKKTLKSRRKSVV